MRVSKQHREALGERLEPFLSDLHRSPAARHVVSVVVCGSAARGEEVAGEGASDVDLMVVTRTRSPLVSHRIAEVVARHAADRIEGGQTPLHALRSYPTLMLYEARETGVVIDGDPGILREIPARGPADIPAWEAVRLLFNRLFEHVKLDAGTTTLESCTAKSYEALCEAQLVLEHRYRPTFREREIEVREHGLDSPVENVAAKFAGALEFRRTGRRGLGPAEPQVALRDLLTGLEHALTAQLGMSDGIDCQLGRLAARERHLAQRLHWALSCAMRGDLHARYLCADPCLLVWASGLEYLRRGVGDPRPLVDAWQRCPQILDAPAPGGARS